MIFFENERGGGGLLGGFFKLLQRIGAFLDLDCVMCDRASLEVIERAFTLTAVFAMKDDRPCIFHEKKITLNFTFWQ